jgi:hypothetical protein
MLFFNSLAYFSNLSVRLFVLCYFVTLVSCMSHNIQTTSGKEFLSGYPAQNRWQSDSEDLEDLDAQVAKVAAIEPNLRFPARIGITRIEHGKMSPMSQAEADMWFEAAKELGASFGEFVPVSHLIAEMVYTPPTGQKIETNQIQAIIRKIRLAAARQHLDVVLLYEVYGKTSRASNPLSVMDLTIIGAYLSPGQSLEAEGYAKALLLDVRNGYPYGTADAVATKESLSARVGSSHRLDKLYEQTSLAAVQNLTQEVKAMFIELKQQLPSVSK